MTRTEAIERLVALDVERWGEGEREAATRLRSALSHGRALNSLAHYDPDRVDHGLAALARQWMVDDDYRDLRRGG